MIRLIRALSAAALWALVWAAPLPATDGAAGRPWTAACADLVGEATATPTRWHGARGATVRSMVRESVRGTPAIISRVTMPALTVEPAPFGRVPDRQPGRAGASMLVSLVAVLIAGMITMYLIFATFGMRRILRETADTQRRMSRVQARLLDTVSSLVSSDRDPPTSCAPTIPGVSRAVCSSASTDHRLALTLSHEITKMQRRIEQLSPESQAAQALDRALQRLRRELMAEGYTIHDPAGQPYTAGMQVMVAEFVPGAGRGESDRIERTVKAEVRYGDTVIQPAVVVVKTHRSKRASRAERELTAEAGRGAAQTPGE